MFLISRDFSRQSGLPLKFVRKLCRNNAIPHIHVGSAYYIDSDGASKKIVEMAQKEISTPKNYLDTITMLQKEKHGYPSK